MRHARLTTELLALAVLTSMVVAAAGAGENTEAASEVAKVEAVLDDFHAAASDADGERYFSHFAPSGVFIGTDATERWTLAEFQAFAQPYFSQGKGWTYDPRDRHVILSADGASAWFDELLDNAKYGECRGSGVLQRYDDAWKIEQYHLTIPIPNDLSVDVVAKIRAHAQASTDGE